MRSLRAYSLKLFYRARVQMARARYRNRPAPLHKIRALQNPYLYNSALHSSLFPSERTLKRDGSALSDELLRTLLAGDTLGWWSLSIDSIEFLLKQIDKMRPRYILEFGSGVSTLCMAVAMRRLHQRNGAPRIFSIEQDAEEIRRLRQRLAAHGLSAMVNLLHAPLSTIHVNGKATTCYGLHEHELATHFKAVRFDFVLIDGPNGPPGTRWGTLPAVLNYLQPGAVFMMDDALRDGEIDIAEQWESISTLRVEGVVFRGKGFLFGTVASG